MLLYLHVPPDVLIDVVVMLALLRVVIVVTFMGDIGPINLNIMELVLELLVELAPLPRLGTFVRRRGGVRSGHAVPVDDQEQTSSGVPKKSATSTGPQGRWDCREVRVQVDVMARLVQRIVAAR